MFFLGKISIDPSQMTIVNRVKPTKLFGKLLHALTFGQTSSREEHETFTAVTILQQINMGVRSVNVQNIVRLRVDDYDFYLDEKGVEDDLKQAMLEFEAKIDPLEAEHFDAIYLVLEHVDQSLKYLIEISIKRKHKVGEFPISISVNGVATDFKRQKDETRAQLEERLKPVFKDQQKYDEFLAQKRAQFDQFMDELEFSIKKFIKVDELRKESNTQILRPKEKRERPVETHPESYSQPIFYNYYGFGDYFFYAWMWGSMCHSHSIYCNNFYMVDETGSDVMSVGDAGFDAGATDTLNDEAAFEPPAEGDVMYYDNNEFEGELADQELLGGGEEYLDESGSDWLDSSDAGDAGACSSCSSCGGCGGCGD